MAYTKTTWENRNPNVPINDANLNKMEEGIRTSHVTADQAASDIGLLNTDSTAQQGELDQLQTDTTTNADAIVAIDGRVTSLEADIAWRTISVDPAATIVAAAKDKIFIAFDGTSEVILPAVPTQTDNIRIADGGALFLTNGNTLEVNPNGANIMGVGGNFVFNTDYGALEFAWAGGTYGWAIVSKSV